ncbi:glycosyltransferase family 2 protein [Flavobacterium hercynium]|uniref:Glycosyltransferase 2-like domain-containing protein n=1 Tax=Flavobacterium hercynium TaxID=387094 RepID=A0A226HD33_9FLAO|nr:glycosyltransferase [Flavobacterium hercynium]OXA92207.1 hypothetical protein B0A66_10625 [Flavobacterium hercynium]SMP24317.1 Glycosyltransferase involved in cell wall bisynthesis [Flavobacterium hercynium]
MFSNPKITVLMPVYNCDLFIKEAIHSVLNQTFSDFELIIIDDASSDSTVSLVKEIEDSRIKLIEKERNSGYTNSLNYGLEIAKGQYIARMDGDDICFPERFAKQVAFLDQNPDIALCGTLFKVIGRDIIVKVPEKHEDMKMAMLRDCCIGHPTVMIRKSYLDKFSLIYDVHKEPAEDYDLWTRLLKVGKLHNLQEVLLDYRVHDAQVSQKRNDQQIKAANEIKINLLNNLALPQDDHQMQSFLKKIVSRREVFSFKEINEFQNLKYKLIIANGNSFFQKEGFEKYLSEVQNNLFRDYFLRRDQYTPINYFQYLKTKKQWINKLKFRDEIKLFVKSMIFHKK